MRFRTLRASLVVCAAVSLFACETAPVLDSAELIKLDKEWIALYERKAGGAAVDDELANLSTRAERRGDIASASDPATAAGLYRIAVTGAWTAGPPRNAQVLSLRDKGNAVCTKVAADPAAQPRDCAFIRVAPGLATLDEQAAVVKAIRDAGATLSVADINKAESVAQTLAQSIQRVLRDRPAPASQSKSFDEYIELNLNRSFCMLPGLVGRVSSNSPPQDQMQRIIASAKSAQDALRAADISTACN
jgi:hypothetical protein